MGAERSFRMPCTLKKTRAGLFLANDQSRSAALSVRTAAHRTMTGSKPARWAEVIVQHYYAVTPTKKFSVPKYTWPGAPRPNAPVRKSAALTHPRRAQRGGATMALQGRQLGVQTHHLATAAARGAHTLEPAAENGKPESMQCWTLRRYARVHNGAEG
jgi:hypothetical protein